MLKNLAIDRLSVKEIWDSGVLSASLPQDQLERMYSKITLDNLYKEGLLNESLDIDLFTIAVSQSVPLFIWPYLNYLPTSDIYKIESHTFDSDCKGNPFDDEFIEKDYREWNDIVSDEEVSIYLQDFAKARKLAVKYFLANLITFVKSPNIPFTAWRFDYFWSRQDNLWKILYLYTCDNHRHSETSYCSTVDELIIDIFTKMSNLYSCDRINLNKDYTHDTITYKYRKALKGMKIGLKVDDDALESLWRDLAMGDIRLTNDFELSLKEFKEGAKFYVLGNYLHIVYKIEEGGNPETAGVYHTSYHKEDGILVLISLFTSDDREYSLAPFYKTSESN